MKKLNRERSFQNRAVAISAIGVALSILLLSFSYFLPFSSLLMMIFIPILSCLVVFNTDWKFQGIYLGIIILVCFIDIQEGFFYLLPNTVIGIFYGNFIKKKMPYELVFFLTVLLSTLLNSLSYFPIKWIFQVDMIDVYRLLIKLEKDEFIIVYPVLCLFISMIETFFLMVISEEELKKFKIVFTNLNSMMVINELALIFGITSYTLAVVYKIYWLSVLLAGISFIPLGIAIFESFSYIVKKKKYFAIWIFVFFSLTLFALNLTLDSKYIAFGLILASIFYPLFNIFVENKKHLSIKEYANKTNFKLR